MKTARDESSIRGTIKEVTSGLVATTDQFCEKYLNSEYKDLCARLVRRLARKRSVPFLSGRRDVWVAAVIYALGQLNFLFDTRLQPHMTTAELCQRMGTNLSTTSQKAKLIRDLLKLRYFDSEFSTRAVLAHDPYVQLARTVLPCFNKEYPEIRRTQKDLQQKIIHHYVTRPLIDVAGHKLGILDGNYLQLENEDEVNVVMDFIIYEVWNPPTNAVQRYNTEIGPASDLEQMLLDGMLQAQGSLFEVQEITGNSLRVKDLLQDNRALEPVPKTLVDIGLSQSIQPGALIFIRFIPLADYGITSGIIFPFRETVKAGLVDAYDLQFSGIPLGEVDPVEKYAFFFKQYHECGIPISYIDI